MQNIASVRTLEKYVEVLRARVREQHGVPTEVPKVGEFEMLKMNHGGVAQVARARVS
jgi:hypothetical protein